MTAYTCGDIPVAFRTTHRIADDCAVGSGALVRGALGRLDPYPVAGARFTFVSPLPDLGERAAPKGQGSLFGL